MSTMNSRNQRQFERFALAPMYTAVSVVAAGQGQEGSEPVAGHAYDISIAGARIELDQGFQPGDVVHATFELPGGVERIEVDGPVVWVNDDEDDPAARRMAIRFTSFRSESDFQRLCRYLGSGVLYRAA